LRELVYYIAVSLDGYIAAPDNTFDAFPLEGDHFETILREYTDTLPAPALAAFGLEPDNARFDTVVMGYNTYAVGLPVGLRDPYPHLEQHVFSTHPRDVPPNVAVHGGDPVGVLRGLKARESGSDIWLCGGGRLASALVGEIDRIILKVNPVLFGSGIPLFAERGYAPVTTTLEASTSFSSGVVINEYRMLHSRSG